MDFSLRGQPESQDFSCTVSGAGGQDVCDASNAADGSSCVWCSTQAFGVCVTEPQAEAMKKAIPGLQCDDDQNDDNQNDDDANADDDVPDDYWECLTKEHDEEGCDQAGCTWCVSKLKSKQEFRGVEIFFV